MSEIWITPSADQVERTIATLVDSSLRQAFFSGLENPEWLMPLKNLGAFTIEPGEVMDAEGNRRSLPWPEGDYLVRIGPIHPEDVSALLAQHHQSNNAWVKRAILNGAAVLPPLQARAHVRAIVQIIRSEAQWLNVDSILKIVSSFADAAMTKPARRLLSALFGPSTNTDNSAQQGGQSDSVWAIDDYQYSYGLLRAVPMIKMFPGLVGLKLVAGWLVSGTQPPSGESRFERSYVWRPSIAPHNQNLAYDSPIDTLINVVRDLAQSLVTSAKLVETVEYLDRSGSFILRRVALEAASNGLAMEQSSEIIDLGLRLITDPDLLDIEARPEYVRLARALFPHLDDRQVLEWSDFVRSPESMPSLEALRGMAAWSKEGDIDTVTEDDVNTMRRHILHRLLQPLGNVLPQELADELAEMTASFGEIPHPEFSSYMTSFVGPTSPKSLSELQQMTAQELSDYLRTWRPGSDHGFGASIEGLSRQLTQLASSSPRLVEEIATDLVSLGRAYVRVAIEGWAKAIVEGHEPSENVWRLVEDVTNMPDDGSTEHDFSEGHDAVWRYAQRAAIGFVVDYIRSHPTMSDEMIQRLWALLRPLLDHADPTPQTESQRDGTSSNAIDRSLNSTRPVALRAAIYLLEQSRMRANRELNDVESDILESLAAHVGTEADPSLAVAATFGEGLGRLASIDSSWFDERTTVFYDVLNLHPNVRAWADVVVSVGLRSYQTGSVFIEIVRPAITKMFTSEYLALEHVDGWPGQYSPIEVAANHLLRGYVFNIVDLEDPELTTFLVKGSTDVKSKVLGHLGWQLMHWNRSDNPPDSAVCERARNIINQRVQEIRDENADVKELGDFHWWVQSGAFEPSWWLPVLWLAVQSDAIEGSPMLGESLANAAQVDPLMTLEIIDHLISTSPNEWTHYDLLSKAPRILAVALLSKDARATGLAQSLQDRLGREGHLDLLREVDSLVKSESEGDPLANGP